MKIKSADSSVVQRKSFDFEVKDITPTGSFTGYGSVFDVVDQGKDIVVPGAFADSLDAMARKGRRLPILWQHRHGEPLGVYESVKEDAHGLLMDGRLLINDVQRAKEAHALMGAKAVNGLSIGYRTLDFDFDSKTNVTKLKKLDLKETSIVTFPMNDDARVSAVKSLGHLLKDGNLPSFAEFEDFLCEAGFSRTQAKALAGAGLRKLHQCEADSNKAGEVVDLLKTFSLT